MQPGKQIEQKMHSFSQKLLKEPEDGLSFRKKSL